MYIQQCKAKDVFHETDLLDDWSCGRDEKRPLTAGVGSCKAISQAGAQVTQASSESDGYSNKGKGGVQIIKMKI